MVLLCSPLHGSGPNLLSVITCKLQLRNCPSWVTKRYKSVWSKSYLPNHFIFKIPIIRYRCIWVTVYFHTTVLVLNIYLVLFNKFRIINSFSATLWDVKRLLWVFYDEVLAGVTEILLQNMLIINEIIQIVTAKTTKLIYLFHSRWWMQY